MLSRPKLSETAQFNKLPKWAQSEIRTLEKRVDRLEDEVRAVLIPVDKVEDGSAVIDDYDSRKGLGLPCNSVGWKGTGIRARAFRGQVELSTSDGQSLVVMPSVTNVIYVMKKDRVKP